MKRDGEKICGKAKRRLFVYGTLKRGLSNHSYLAGQAFVGKARTSPVYRMFDLGGYPGMVRVGAGGAGIEGEIWEVDDACLRSLDVLEDVAGGEYERVIVELEPPFVGQDVEGYLFLREVTGRREAGTVWGAT